MNISIVLEASAPPSGYVRLDPQAGEGSGELPAIQFIGWLDLLRALADAVEGRDPARSQKHNTECECA